MGIAAGAEAGVRPWTLIPVEPLDGSDSSSLAYDQHHVGQVSREIDPSRRFIYDRERESVRVNCIL